MERKRRSGVSVDTLPVALTYSARKAPIQVARKTATARPDTGKSLIIDRETCPSGGIAESENGSFPRREFLLRELAQLPGYCWK